MSEHITETKHTRAGGALASCSCGWQSHWGVQDGSAEEDAVAHRASVGASKIYASVNELKKPETGGDGA